MPALISGLSLIGLFLFLSSVSASVVANSLIFAVAPEVPNPLPGYEQVLENADSKVLKTRVHYRELENTPGKQQVWQRFTDFLSQKTGLRVEFVATASQLSFERDLARGKFDIAYTSPLQFISARESQSYQAIAKRKAQPLRGLIVVLDQDKARTLRDIETSVIGFSSLLDYSNSIITRVSLRNVNIQPPIKLYPNTASLLLALERDNLRSISLAQHELEALAPDTVERLRILWETPGFTPYALAVHPRVPFYSINKLQRALASLSRKEEYGELLNQLHAVNGFEIARNSDWVDAEKIRLEELNQHLNIISSPE